MITHGRGTRIGQYYVVSGALETKSKMFAPVFVIYEGTDALGKIVHRQDLPVTNALELSNVEDAFATADEIAARWIEHRQLTIG